MKNRHTLMFIASLMVGGVMEPDATAANQSTSESVQSVALNEREISDFVIEVAQIDIGNLDRIAEFVRGDWRLARASQNQADGWILREAKSIDSPSWIKGAEHEIYVEKGSNKAMPVVTSAGLSIKFRDGVCFTGKLFMQPKYKRGDITDSIRAQPRDGVGMVSLFSIAGRAVDFRYTADNRCVREITFFGARQPA